MIGCSKIVNLQRHFPEIHFAYVYTLNMIYCLQCKHMMI